MTDEISQTVETKRLYIRAFLAITTNIGFLSVVGWIVYRGLPINGTGRDILLMLLGALVTLATQVNSFYFGSSQGSADKTELLAAE